MEKVREFLREDDSREARQLLSKIIEEKGVDDLLITLADCLKDQIRNGVSEQSIRDQLHIYTDSWFRLGGSARQCLAARSAARARSLTSGCDLGPRDDAPAHGPPVHLLASYPADGQGTNAPFGPDGVTCDSPATPDCAGADQRRD